MSRLYIAGPMTGLPEFNYPAFHAAAAAWRALGWEVMNPAENFGGSMGMPYPDYIRNDLADLMSSTAVAFLPGWEASKGAKLERHVAEVLELSLFDATDPIPCPEGAS